MKTGISSYSYAKLMKNGGFTMLDAIEHAGKTGFDMFEFAGIQPPDDVKKADYARLIKETCKVSGMEPGNYTIAADFLTENLKPHEIKEEIERVKQEIAIAKILGSPGMRHDASWGYKNNAIGARSFDDAMPILIQACREVTDYAAEQNIKTMVENHGLFCQDSDRVERLICGVNHKNFGLLLDIGNFLCVDEAPEKAVGRLSQYAFHVHAKDFHVKSGILPYPGAGWFTSRGGNYLLGTVIGFGSVPVTQCLNIVKNAGYDGTVSLEFEGAEETLTAIETGYANLKRFIADL